MELEAVEVSLGIQFPKLFHTILFGQSMGDCVLKSQISACSLCT